MEWKKQLKQKKVYLTAVFVAVNLLAIAILTCRESTAIHQELYNHAQTTQEQFADVMTGYRRSFQLFSHLLTREVESHPDPDAIWEYLKSVDTPLLAIEGETFDGLYMYYKGRYLYSWDTPYSAYEDTGYVATERPWYTGALAGNGEIVFTPPYMSYANHYILTTISQLQPDGETVFAYDIKMGDIQSLVTAANQFENEQILIFDSNGTVIGSTRADYLGGNLYASPEDAARQVQEAEAERASIDPADEGSLAKADDKVRSATAFSAFRKEVDSGFSSLRLQEGEVILLQVGKTRYTGLLKREGDFGFLILVPLLSILKATANVWLVPLLVVELLLIYAMARISKEQKNREIQAAYVELGQIQKRLELALSAAQKAAAVDDLTGTMNFKSFRRGVTDLLESMDEGESGILVMIDGDRFKRVNDNYGHIVGDEVIKLSAQMIVGRIRTVDLASRLHGDEFAIFIADTADYTVAKRIMEDINKTIFKEAEKRNIPPITLSAGAVVAKKGDNYATLAKAADVALYKAKETHNGGFASFADVQAEAASPAQD